MALLQACMGTGLSREAGEPAQSQRSAAAVGETVTVLANDIMRVYQDARNTYWFGSWEQGLYRYDGDVLLRYTTDDGLLGNKIISIQEDAAGSLYFHTDVGISRYDGRRFTTLSVTGNSWELRPDDLWFTGPQNSGEVYRYDGSELHLLELPRTPRGDTLHATSSVLPYPYNPYDVYTIYRDARGHVWFGTSSLGACRYDGTSFTWISEEELGFDVGTGFGIRSIQEDRDGNYWFSNTLHRFAVMADGRYSKLQGMDRVARDQRFGPEAIISMLRDEEGLWMATYDQGVWRYDGEQLTHYPVEQDGASVTLFSIVKDRKGALWLGTHAHGAYTFDGRNFVPFVSPRRDPSGGRPAGTMPGRDRR